MAIAKRLAANSASIACTAKPDKPPPGRPGTVQAAAAEMEVVGGQAPPSIGGIRLEDPGHTSPRAQFDRMNKARQGRPLGQRRALLEPIGPFVETTRRLRAR